MFLMEKTRGCSIVLLQVALNESVESVFSALFVCLFVCFFQDYPNKKITFLNIWHGVKVGSGSWDPGSLSKFKIGTGDPPKV